MSPSRASHLLGPLVCPCIQSSRRYFGPPEAWLEHEFASIVGLEDLKAQIRRFQRAVVLDKKRGVASSATGDTRG